MVHRLSPSAVGLLLYWFCCFRIRRHADEEMVRFFRPCGLRMLLWRFSSILRYAGRAGSMEVSRRSTAMAGPEDRHVKESFRVDFQLCRPRGIRRDRR